MNDFYVYVHKYKSGVTAGKIFYVGKGRKFRAWSKYSRNSKWKSCTGLNEYSVDIVLNNISETDALDFENLLITEIGLINLTNLSLGGKGSSGFKLSEETKRKIGESSKGRRKGVTVTLETREKQRLSNTLNREALNARGFDNTGKKWTTSMREKLLRPELRKRIGMIQRKPVMCSNGMRFSHAKNAVEWLKVTGYDAATNANISKCCLGLRKSAYGFGWTFINK